MTGRRVPSKQSVEKKVDSSSKNSSHRSPKCEAVDAATRCAKSFSVEAKAAKRRMVTKLKEVQRSVENVRRLLVEESCARAVGGLILEASFGAPSLVGVLDTVRGRALRGEWDYARRSAEIERLTKLHAAIEDWIPVPNKKKLDVPARVSGADDEVSNDDVGLYNDPLLCEMPDIP